MAGGARRSQRFDIVADAQLCVAFPWFAGGCCSRCWRKARLSAGVRGGDLGFEAVVIVGVGAGGCVCVFVVR